MTPVSSEGNPVDEDLPPPRRVICRSWKNIQGEGGSLVSSSPPHLSSAIPQLPTRWCRENGLRLLSSAPHPRRMALDLDLPKVRSHVCLAPFISQKCGLSLALSLPKCHPVAPQVCLFKAVPVLSSVSAPLVFKPVWLKQIRAIP